MSDDIFAEMAGQLRPTDETRDDLLRVIAAEEAGAAGSEPEPVAKPTRRWPMVGWVAAAAAVALVAGIALVPRLFGTPDTLEFADPPQSGVAAGGAPEGEDPAGFDGPEPAAAPASDYATVYAAVRKAAERWYGGGRDGSFGMAASAGGRAPAPVAWAAADQAASTESYRTNTQVAGIDEGDLVKSDGKTLFIASGTDVALVAPQGAGTRVLARIDTTAGAAGPDRAGQEYVVQGSVVDLMLDGSTLVVLVTEYAPRLDQLPNSVTTAYVPYDARQTKALLYDVSDPASPVFLTSLGQSGAYLTSRLVGNLLYLVTEHIVPDSGGIEADDPATFVPLVSQGRQSVPLDAADCVVLPNPQGPRFAVASSIDLAKRARVDTESVLGGSETVYLNADNLYLGAADYDQALSKQARKAAGVSELREVWGTRLTRIALKDGELTVAGQGVVPGSVINQFALDEYDGHLRVAVTVSGETSRRGWLSRPALYVLDSELKIVGSLPELAKNESVQSVRFEGSIGYVVSFERVDPLFALDLSRPEQPKVMSALKIPGFSTYLHPWSEGRLLGLGMDADANGSTTGMKLSMFDTSDPFDVTEQTNLKVPFDDSEALYNHKAVLVDAQAGLIGLPATSWRSDKVSQRYLVYRYADGGFVLEEKLQPTVPDDGYGVRGLTLNGDLYIASSAGVDVYRLDGFDQVAAVTLR